MHRSCARIKSGKGGKAGLVGLMQGERSFPYDRYARTTTHTSLINNPSIYRPMLKMPGECGELKIYRCAADPGPVVVPLC